jgi:RNA polymerase sigma factor (TIGR02999 family)
MAAPSAVENPMNQVTQILNAVADGDTDVGRQLLPIVYDELRRLAAHKMAAEREGHTLQPTALVHEAYVRLLGPDGEAMDWDSRGHFFAAAAEAMRRVLIDSARRKASLKRGGDHQRLTWDENKFESASPSDEVLLVNDALDKLEAQNPEFAKIVKLHYFAGLSVEETAAVLDVSQSTVDRKWKAAKTWLFREISESRDPQPSPPPETNDDPQNK